MLAVATIFTGLSIQLHWIVRGGGLIHEMNNYTYTCVCKNLKYRTAHVKEKHIFPTGHTQIDNAFHMRDYLGACGLHAAHHTLVEKSTPIQPTEAFVI